MTTFLTVLRYIALILSRALQAYSIMIWIRILLSWFIRELRPGTITYYLAKIVDPYLNLFRRSGIRIGILDFSPILAFMCIGLLKSLLQYFGIYGKITVGYLLALFLQFFWSYALSFFLIIAGILLLVRVVAVILRNPNTKALLMRITQAADPIVNVVRSIFRAFTRKGKKPNELAVTITSFLVLFLLYFLLRWLFQYLETICITKIPF